MSLANITTSMKELEHQGAYGPRCCVRRWEEVNGIMDAEFPNTRAILFHAVLSPQSL